MVCFIQFKEICNEFLFKFGHDDLKIQCNIIVFVEMIRTTFCAFPDSNGKVDNSLCFAKEYHRISVGVLPNAKNRLNFLSLQKDANFQGPMPIDQFMKQNIISKSASSLLSDSSNNPNTFNVGRLIIICEPDCIILPEPKNEIFLSIANNCKDQIEKALSITFDRLFLELIFFSKSSIYSKIDVLSQDKLMHVIVKHPDESERYAQLLAYNHLKLSEFKMSSFLIYFLNIFEQTSVRVEKPRYQSPEELVGPVKVTYPCVIMNKTMPVSDELKSNVITFNNQWLLSSYQNSCFLSKIGEPLEGFSSKDSVIKKFSFRPDPTKNRLIQEMPAKLIIKPIGDNWKFKRTKPSQAINKLSKFAKFEDRNSVLFSPYFMSDETRHQKAISLLAPILTAIAKSSPNSEEVSLAIKSINNLFTQLLNAAQDILNEIVLSENPPTDQATYIKALDEKRKSLLNDIKEILSWYGSSNEKNSEGHKQIYQAFLNKETMTGPISYNIQYQ